MIQVMHISKCFGKSLALQDVSFHIKESERVLLLGPNGAGKTTLLRIIAGMTVPSSGEVLISGGNTRPRREERARLIGYVGHPCMLYDDLTVEENLHFFGALYGLRPSVKLDRASALMEAAEMADHRGAYVSQLSQGQRKRVSLARALMHDPQVLLLDEPFSALDASGREWLGRLLGGSPEKTILLATHQPEQDFPSAERVLALVDGILVSDRGCIDRDGGSNVSRSKA